MSTLCPSIVAFFGLPVQYTSLSLCPKMCDWQKDFILSCKIYWPGARDCTSQLVADPVPVHHCESGFRVQMGLSRSWVGCRAERCSRALPLSGAVQRPLRAQARALVGPGGALPAWLPGLALRPSLGTQATEGPVLLTLACASLGPARRIALCGRSWQAVGRTAGPMALRFALP